MGPTHYRWVRYWRNRRSSLNHNHDYLPRCKSTPFLAHPSIHPPRHRHNSNDPKDLIATVAALTLSIRVIGGSIGYTIYYNIFISKFVTNAEHYIGGVMVQQLNITNSTYIAHAIELTGSSLLPELKHIPGIAGSEAAYEAVVKAGQIAYAESYKWVYYASIGFGGVSILAACFLGGIEKYMDDHIAVRM